MFFNERRLTQKFVLEETNILTGRYPLDTVSHFVQVSCEVCFIERLLLKFFISVDIIQV